MKVSLENIKKVNQKMINEGKIKDPNYMDITKIVFSEVGGITYKLEEQKNLPPEFNINGMLIIDGRVFTRVWA
jgi:hypothetical protein